ncbi:MULTISPECIES: inorganic diphosphatase [Chryseobacterium]|uniref:Inorganic pyrophosphatase n=2 Tax=Chryseobacterium TaxID=59732 RepID=J3CFX4_9FLAO|nr:MULTISPECIES: inorganic diphosphatase [Chryseobacterium]AZA92904.1 inorganic diphosphatase [Chryseobacterium nakagawai]EJL70576.1 inorganic pyrophosphatase [Chryseobacterium populi]VEH19522.1 Inorganic pyrophosphatase [Chryseobacterium nakagawai]
MIGNQHPWHDVSPGDNLPQIVTAVIEIPSGSHTKYEIDKLSGLIRLDRILLSSMYYPANYGIIPKTYYSDGDPLDILVLCSESLVPLTLVNARVIGIMEMTDEEKKDHKIIAVAENDSSLADVHDIEDLSVYTVNGIQNFFEEYKKLEGKTVQVFGFKNKEEAYACIEESLMIYAKEIKPKIKED